jgi:hypothetical protein
MPRGSILDILPFFVITSVVIIAWFTIYYINGEITTGLNQSLGGDAPTSPQAQEILGYSNDAQDAIVSSAPFVIIGSGLAAVVSAALIYAHPVFFPISLVLLAIFTFASAYIANMLNAFYSTGVFVAVANAYPVIPSLIANYPWITLGLGLLIMLVQYGRPQNPIGP